MIKNLTRHGNSAALVIEKPILDLLGATIDTAFEVVTDGQALVLTPVKDAVRAGKFHNSMDKIGKRYKKSYDYLGKCNLRRSFLHSQKSLRFIITRLRTSAVLPECVIWNF